MKTIIEPVEEIRSGILGHGVEVLAEPVDDWHVLAFVHGYGWLHGDSGEVKISVVREWLGFSEKERVETLFLLKECLQRRKVFQGNLTEKTFAWFNG